MSTPPPKRSALGKGLESLLPSRPAAAPVAPPAPVVVNPPAPTGKPLEIDVELIDRNPFQTRTHFDEEKLAELAESIKASGVVQPIVVRSKSADGSDPKRFTLITGERRLMASKKAGKATIPAIIREVSDVQAMEMTIVENLQRADLNPMEQARAYQRLSQEFKLTQEQMAERTGKDRASVANFLRLLRLPPTVQPYVESGELSFGHARALLALPEPDLMLKFATEVVEQALSVRNLESRIFDYLNPGAKEDAKQPAKPAQPTDPNVREAEDMLRRSLGLKVKIEDKKGKGKVIIEYSGVEDFDAILTALGKNSRSE